jgi:single-strand DNA-binding protein
VTKFSVATDHSYKDASGEWQKTTSWHSVVLWGNEKLAPLLVKGVVVAVEGRLETRSYEDKQGQKRYVTEVVADNVVLCGGSSGPESNHGRPQRSSSSPFDGDDGDVPF